MSDPYLKVSDVKSLQELAGVLTYPAIAIAYFMQTGANIGFNVEGGFQWGISETLNVNTQIFLFITYFTLKTIWVCGIFFLAKLILHLLDEEYLKLGLAIASVVFIGIGLMGLFAHDSFPLLSKINNFWFIASLIWGFSCSGRIESTSALRPKQIIESADGNRS